MRRDYLYLTDVVEAADAIGRFITGQSRETFISDELVQSAVLQKLIIIGEAVSHLSAEFRAGYSDIEWTDIIAFRNIAVHVYFAVDWSIVWVASTHDAPLIRQQIKDILAKDFADQDPAES
jgi:uncharacterized protein with HEPN domain